jgi:mannose-6-phosphate isomerase-like protein (cupin superfamily)
MIRRIFCSLAMFVVAGASARADDVRRVVTGLDHNNKAVVLFDSRLPLTPAPGPYPFTSTNLWITDSYPPGFSNKETANRPLGVSPPENGTKFRIVEFPPLDAATEAKLPPDLVLRGVNPVPKRGLPVTHPMMHRTRTLDYAVVLSGEIDMLLDGGPVHVKTGDVVVQQATNHGWVNHGTQPCRILFVLMDSKEP